MSAARYYDHYPYEQRTPEDVANIARMQDRTITDLRAENLNLQNELYKIQQWRAKVIPILLANDIDVNEITYVMEATKEVFGE